MDLKLQGNKALITGASKGIGSSSAGDWQRRVVTSLLLPVRRPISMRRRGCARRRVEVDAVDLSDDDRVIALAQGHGDVDILINNAGALPGGHVLDIGEATWRKAWDLKVFGYINMCREFYRPFKARGRGTIINVIGIGAVMKYPWYMCGAGGNAAVAAFTNTLGGESHKDGIRVLGVSPGPVATKRARLVLAQGGVVGSGQDMVQNTFGREWASPEQIADVVAFMASGRASYITVAGQL
jgi:NAD(P)-dependent dehydrogenase (short-subunit alcohol dehydrogenase family)